MNNILAFGGSNSSTSINKRFANYAANCVADSEVTLLDLNEYEMPIFSVDREKSGGIPQLAHDFKEHIKSSDAIVISFAEHNGSYSVAFKNIFDWISRIEKDVWANKPMLLLSTSPGRRGGITVLETAFAKFSHMNRGGIKSFSLPFFKANFSEAEGITEVELKENFQRTLNEFTELLSKSIEAVAK